LIGLTGALAVLALLIPLIAHNKIDQKFGEYLGFPTIALTVLLPVVSILTLTSEWTQRTVLTTFTQEPRRARVVWAKVAVSVAMAGVGAVVGAGIALGGLAISSALGRDVQWSVSGGHLFGYALFIVLNILMAVAFGALLHNTAAAIVLFFIVPTAFSLIGVAVSVIQRWFDPGTVFNYALESEWAGHGGPLLLCAAIWVVLPLAAGVVRTVRREIK
jgi:ABC-type transport system involved in multi-copper enzyme maturation permease subunit